MLYSCTPSNAKLDFDYLIKKLTIIQDMQQVSLPLTNSFFL